MPQESSRGLSAPLPLDVAERGPTNTADRSNDGDPPVSRATSPVSGLSMAHFRALSRVSNRFPEIIVRDLMLRAAELEHEGEGPPPFVNAGKSSRRSHT